MAGILAKEYIELSFEVQELERTTIKQRELLEEAFLIFNDDFIQHDKRKEFERKLGDFLNQTKDNT